MIELFINTSVMRIDKFIWAVRLFKTRSIATQACRNRKVLMNGQFVKPSRNIGKDDIFQVKKAPVLYTYKCIEPLEKRVSAKFVPNYLDDLTPEEELHKLNVQQSMTFVLRPKGSGRPTKKERRLLDEFNEKKNNDL